MEKYKTQQKKNIRSITFIGIFANILLCVLKYILGVVSNSQAVVADAIHSLSDTSSDIVILFGVKYWMSPPDDEHPYGHLKIESFVTIIIGLILLFASLGIGYNAIATIRDIDTEPLKWMVFIGPLLSIFIKEWLYRITYQVGVETNSSAVKANAWHHRSDAVSSIPVLFAVIVSYINPKLSFLDHVGAIVVSAFIIKISFSIIFKSLADLIDTGISQDKLKEIIAMTNSIEGVEGVHAVRSRKIASSVSIDLHLEVDGDLSVYTGHDISEKAKELIQSKNPQIIDVLIHLEPK